MSSAIFICGNMETGYAPELLRWARENNAAVYHDGRENREPHHHHYLNFYWHQRQNPFDQIVYRIQDNRESAPLYYLLLKYPGLLLLESDSLFEFAAAISHSLDDPWGSGHLMKLSRFSNYPALQRLRTIGLEICSKPFGRRISAWLCQVSRAAAVSHYEHYLALQKSVSSLALLPTGELPSRLEALLKDLPAVRSEKSPPPTPHDSFAQRQQELIRGQFFPRHYFSARPAELAFEEVFRHIDHISEPNDSGKKNDD